MDDRVGKIQPGNRPDPESAYVLPTASLPWARPHQLMYGGSNSGSGKFEIPKLGSIVRITFDNGNYYQPVYHENIYPSGQFHPIIRSDEKRIMQVLLGLQSNSLKFTTEGKIKIFVSIIESEDDMNKSQYV